MDPLVGTARHRLFEPPRNAYYIVAPTYVRTSAGIKALHLLCHALNRIGERAYMVMRPFLRGVPATHPDLLTRLLTEDVILADAARGLTPITVYPETIAGNPFNAPLVVRYVMNFPGLLGGEAKFGEGELCYGYSAVLAESIGAPDKVLFVPASDTDVFQPEPRVARSGTCFFAGKYRYFHGGELSALTAGSFEITRDQENSPTPEQIASIFRRSELFYCYENSALAIEAVLCDCPVVFLPNPKFTRIIGSKELGPDGYAWGTDPAEIERAKKTVAQGRLNYLRAYDEFWVQLARFVETTQARARATPYTQPMAARKINRISGIERIQQFSRAAMFVLRTQGWRAFFRKAVKRIVRTLSWSQ